MVYYSLCLSGGGINGLVILGALKFVLDKKILILNRVKNFVGTSIGSLIIFLLVIGYSINDIIQIFYDLNLEKFKVEFDLEDLINNYGIENGSRILTVIQTLLYTKLKIYDITFAELFNKTKKKINIIAVNYSKKKEVNFNHIDYPNLSVISAMRMSISIPFIFHPFKFEGDLYVDGSVMNNFGIEYCDLKTTIGICLDYTLTTKCENILEYFLGYFSIFNKITTLKKQHENIIVIKKKVEGLSNFNPDKEKKFELLKEGYIKTKEICQNDINFFATKFINRIINQVLLDI